MDGTFAVVPATFTQLWTVHVRVGFSFRPCIYALLPNKKMASYVHVLQVLKERLPLLMPKMVSMDFEQGAISAFKSEFPDTKILGCNFHFGQSLWRKIQKEGHSSQYLQDPTFAFRCRHFLALAYIPETGNKSMSVFI